MILMNFNGKLTIGINNGSLTSPNLGVQALTYSVIQLFDEVLNVHNMYMDVILFDTHKEFDATRIVINGRPISCKSVKFVMTKKIWLDKYFHRNIVDNWRKCDLIVDLNGGDSWSDIYGKKRFYVAFLSLLTILRLKKPLIFPPQTIGPFYGILPRMLSNYIMRYCVKVYPRDKKSADYLAANVKNKKFETFPDMALFLPYKQTLHENKTIKFGINVSGLLYNGGYTGNNQFKLNLDYKQLINDILKWCTTQNGIEIHLVPHVIEMEEMKTEDDLSACLDVKKEFPTCILANCFSTPMEAKSYISGLDFFIGARMHSTIAAISSGIPVVPMAYSRKFSGLFCDTLNYQYVMDMTILSKEQCLDMLKRVVYNRTEIKREIDGLNNTLSTVRQNFLTSVWNDLIEGKIVR